MKQTHLFPVIMGIAIGAVAALLVQSSSTTAQGEPARAMYQIAPIAQAAAMVWRLNTATGDMELCYATNRGDWIAGNAALEGRCATMPAPSI